MIVFWRLFLAYYIADFALYGKRFYCYGECHPWKLALARGILFWAVAMVLCRLYLTMPWSLCGITEVPGWVALLPMTAFYIFSDGWFKISGTRKFHNTLSFVLHDTFNFLVLLLCVPFHALYETGSFFAEKWVIFCVGLMLVTKVLGTFIFCVEKDLYGRDYPTADERWIMMMVRAIFFLTGLLPGWRWLFLTCGCWACVVYARKIRLMDVSGFAFYFGFGVTCLISWAVHWRVYLNW